MTDLAQNCGEYRLRRCHLIIGVVGTVVFSSIGIVATAAALWNIDGSFSRPVLSAVIFGVFYLGLTLLGASVILAYFRKRLILRGTQIAQRGIVRAKSINADEVTLVRWRQAPRGGSVVVYTPAHRLTIRLANFTAEEQEQIVTFVRGLVDPQLQEDWSPVEDANARPFSRTTIPSHAVSVTLSVALLLFAGVFVCGWFCGLGRFYLVLGCFNGACVPWYWWQLSRRRQRLSNRNDG